MNHNWVFIRAEDDEYFITEENEVVKSITLLYLCGNPGCDKYLSFAVRREGTPLLWRLIKESQRKADAMCIEKGCECHGYT